MRKTASLGLLLLATALAACADTPDSTGPNAPNYAVVPAEQANSPTVASERLSSFGGMFIDEAGRPTVYLTNMGDAPKARQIMRNFAEENGASPLEIQFLPAAFRYTQLNDWYDRTWPEVLALPGAVMTDLDEGTNHIRFGVEHAGVMNGVRAVMRAHGVPENAYTVEVVPPVDNLLTLQQEVNPKVGGIQIHFGQYLCTLGFNANWNGRASFITNSHCTNKQGGVESTNYYQPTSSVNPTVIATEVADPTYVKGGVCPRGKNCRYSDSSRAEYKSGIAFDLGGLAAVSGAGSLTITGTNRISSEADQSTTPVAVGGTVSKTGRTTGLSTGRVTQTCVNVSVQGGNIAQLCQSVVSATVDHGDSGSPVTSGNALVGILWGGSGTTTFIFSPLKSIKDELGAFAAH